MQNTHEKIGKLKIRMKLLWVSNFFFFLLLILFYSPLTYDLGHTDESIERLRPHKIKIAAAEKKKGTTFSIIIKFGSLKLSSGTK